MLLGQEIEGLDAQGRKGGDEREEDKLETIN